MTIELFGYTLPLSLDVIGVAAIVMVVLLYLLVIQREYGYLKRIEEATRDLLDGTVTGHLDPNALHGRSLFVRRLSTIFQTIQERVIQRERLMNDALASSKVFAYQNQKMEIALQTFPDALIIVDETGAAAFASRKLQAMVGIDHEALMGKQPNEWTDSVELTAVLSKIPTLSHGRLGSILHTFTPEHAPEKQISIIVYPLLAEGKRGDRLGSVVLFRDITTEFTAKKARGDFVGNLSHELKTPLNVIGMYAETLLDDDVDPAMVIDAANVIRDEVERSAIMINNMLNITRIEMGNVALTRIRTKLRDLLDDALTSVSRAGQAKEDLTFEVKIPEDLSPIHVDKELLRVAINNLLTNAIKYNRPGGTVLLGAEENEEEISVYVQDSGIGIKEEEQKRIFDKFFRSEDELAREQSGHGLGLSLAKQIIEMHQGSMTLKSTFGEGSRFTMTFKKTPTLMREAL
ncbi:MAG: PAS domain S-box protein [Magnetococcales bacterium]|nr:PAS domain S-box protein [Magnetococcales bacterium]